MCLLVSDKTSTSASPTLAEPKEFNMGLEVSATPTPKSPKATSPNPNIMRNFCLRKNLKSPETMEVRRWTNKKWKKK